MKNNEPMTNKVMCAYEIMKLTGYEINAYVCVNMEMTKMWYMEMSKDEMYEHDILYL